MKKKIVLVFIGMILAVSIFGCGKKKEEKNPITPTPERIEEDNGKNKDLSELKELPDPKNIFRLSEKIKDEYSVNSKGNITRCIQVYGTWSQEEVDTYKKLAIKSGNFINTDYDYTSYFAASSEDGRFYIRIGEDAEKGRPVLLIRFLRYEKEETK